MASEKYPSDQQAVDSLIDTYSSARNGSMSVTDAIAQASQTVDLVTKHEGVLTDARKSAVAAQVMTRLAVLVENPETQQSALEKAQLQLGSASRKLYFDAHFGIPIGNNTVKLAQEDWLPGARKYIGSLILQRQVDTMSEAVDGYVSYGNLKKLVRPTDAKSLSKIDTLQSEFMERAANQPFINLPEHGSQVPTDTHKRFKRITGLFTEAWSPDIRDKDARAELLNESLSEAITFLSNPDNVAQLDIISKASLGQLVAQTVHDLADLEQFRDNHGAKLASIAYLGKISDDLSDPIEDFDKIKPKRLEDMSLSELVIVRERYTPDYGRFVEDVDKKKKNLWYFQNKYARESGVSPDSSAISAAPKIIELATEYIEELKSTENEPAENKIAA